MIDQKTINRIRKLLAQRHGLNLPPDVTPETFGRDLLCALHGHPGYPQDPELIDDDFDEDDAGDLGEEEGDDLDDEDEDDGGAGQLSHGRRPITAKRSAEVVREFCRNTHLT